jgi:hypothetical protein
MVSVAATETGMVSQDIDRIVNPLFGTKSDGMGMGLFRSIIKARDSPPRRQHRVDRRQKRCYQKGMRPVHSAVAISKRAGGINGATRAHFWSVKSLG